MSYTIRILKEVHRGNYTYNVHKMFSTAYENILDRVASYIFPSGEGKVYFKDWKEAIQDSTFGRNILAMLIEELKSKPDFYSQYNSENGWGDYQGAIKFLEDALNAYEERYEYRLELS